jgi:histidinol-phosphate aminotransferase
MMMTRRDYLAASGITIGGLAMPGARGAGHDGGYLGARLSLNENPFGPSQSALAAIQGQFGRLCRYVDESSDMLTPAIVRRETISADQIVLGEVLEVLGMFLAKDGPSGGEFIYSQPGYTALVDAVEPGGGVVIGVPLNQDLQNDLPAIASKVSKRTRAIYLVNPHNPSGTVSDAVKFRNFVREMSRITTVIVDEAYLEFEADFAQRTVVDLTRAGENVVVFRTFSKIYSLAGLSVGYAVAPTRLANALKYVRIGTPDTFTLPALAGAAASLGDRNYIETMRIRVIAEREKWNELFRSMKIQYSDSRGNFVFFETGRPHSEIAAALRTRGIEIGRSFPPLERWARISIGLPQENIMARRAVAELFG